jgi:hypothetical protein
MRPLFVLTLVPIGTTTALLGRRALLGRTLAAAAVLPRAAAGAAVADFTFDGGSAIELDQDGPRVRVRGVRSVSRGEAVASALGMESDTIRIELVTGPQDPR